ncbi:hypothetical protein [Bacillus mycoides]|uniref:Uncharacterized protein n=1 Tax=Bacillus mycoides (strain KBAB4) TaxID=315730 RepID=A9VVK6_BACMK|nr:hypothetical protein [Bacillus mycoides]ABY46821.1 hypothetical protein BcerKBAB4_5327 [Bacillus mycoides KBAB4]
MQNPFLGKLVEVGEDGTITIPKFMLEFAGIELPTTVEVLGTLGGVVINQTEHRCTACSRNIKTHDWEGTRICEDCYTKITTLRWGETAEDKAVREEMEARIRREEAELEYLERVRLRKIARMYGADERLEYVEMVNGMMRSRDLRTWLIEEANIPKDVVDGAEVTDVE